MKEPSFEMIETNGVRLRVVVKGAGPLCVLVHGWPESWYSFRPQIEPLVTAGYRVAIPDVRGYGGSDKPDAIEAYDMVSLTDDIAGLIDALGESSAILIGHDWGAPIVWVTAIRHAAKVRAVVGMSVPHLGRGKRPTTELYREIYKDRFFYQLYFQEPGVAEAELEADIAASIRKIYYGSSGDTPAQGGLSGDKGPDATLLQGLIDPDPLPQWLTAQDVEYYAEQFRGSGFRGPLNRYRNHRRDHAFLRPHAKTPIAQPSLFVGGSRDLVLKMLPGADMLAMMRPNLTDLRGATILDGIGHWTQQEAPAAVNDLLADWLRGL